MHVLACPGIVVIPPNDDHNDRLNYRPWLIDGLNTKLFGGGGELLICSAKPLLHVAIVNVIVN